MLTGRPSRNCGLTASWSAVCDIVIEMYQRGELQQLIKETAAKYKSEEPDAGIIRPAILTDANGHPSVLSLSPIQPLWRT
ncbi:monothiol glutaredoxin YdhD [Escherichia coli]|uniref:Monothiol glutaredoxin YdhD n=1 Tax=Escherichia coli TaxID=562 RepID=A0A376S7L2_ECOLX|nr:monothiol glutaredoxin YdhD [Escherichia coli]